MAKIQELTRMAERRWREEDRESLRCALRAALGKAWRDVLADAWRQHVGKDEGTFILYLFAHLEDGLLEEDVLDHMGESAEPALMPAYYLRMAGGAKTAETVRRWLHGRWEPFEKGKRTVGERLSRIYHMLRAGGTRSAAEHLMDRFLTESDPVMRIVFLERLRETADSEVILALNRRVPLESDPLVRAHAVWTIAYAALPDAREVDLLAEYLKHDPSPDVRCTAAEWLMKKAPVTPLSFRLATPIYADLRSEDGRPVHRYLPDREYNALRRFINLPHGAIYPRLSQDAPWKARIVDPLTETLECDRAPAVRKKACEALAEIATHLSRTGVGEDAVSRIEWAIRRAAEQDGDEGVRSHAKRLLEQGEKKAGDK